MNGSTEVLARASVLGGGEIAFVQGTWRTAAALDALVCPLPGERRCIWPGKPVGESVPGPIPT